MANYYTGQTTGGAFSEGLMAGYSFVENIRNRRRALELQERQMGLAENADTRAQRVLDISEEERARDNTREDVIDTRATTVFDQQQGEFTRGQRVRDETEGARRELAGGLLEGGGPTSLSAIGATGMQRTRAPATAPQTNVRDSVQTPDVRDSVQPTGPVDLRSAQLARDNEPNFIERMLSGPVEKSATKMWDAVADSSSDDAVILQGRGKAISAADVRRDPAKFADKYFSERDKVSPQARASLDLTMSGALNERRQALIAEGNTRGVSRIDSQISQLAKSVTSSAAVDGGITRPVKVSDERLVPAITNAAARAREAQPMLEATPDELRAATTVVGRIGGAKRLNEKQISALTTLFAHGQIDAEQLQNWSTYGTPVAPKSPTVHAIGNGTAIIMQPNGQMSFVQAPGAGGTGMKDSEVRLRQKENMTTMFNGIKGAVEAGELDGDPSALFNEMLVTLGRTAGDVQSRAGVPLVDPRDNAVKFHEISPTEAAEFVKGFVAFHNGEVDTPWYRFRQNKEFADYLPQQLAPGAVVDGFQYLGGDPNNEASWQAAQ